MRISHETPVNRKSRVVLIVPVFPQISETFIVSKFLGLLGRGWDVHVVCLRLGQGSWERFPLLDDGDLRRRIHTGWPIRPKALAAGLAPFAFLHAAVRNPTGFCRHLWTGVQANGFRGFIDSYFDSMVTALRPDLVHFEFGALAHRRIQLVTDLRAKSVVSFRGHDLGFVSLGEKCFYDEVWRKADSIHLLGENLWREAQARGCPSDKPHVFIPPALDLESIPRPHRKPAITRGQPTRILSIGRLHWMKGHEYALQAIEELVERGVPVEYRIVGGGQFEEALQFACHQLGLGGSVHFLGSMSHSEVFQQLRWADILLHPSVNEGFCNALLEAQALMVPVVCSDAGGISENVIDGETGFVVDRRNPGLLAERLAQLARNPRLRQQMGEAGRRRVESCFRLEDQIGAFDRLYDGLLQGPGHDV